MGAAGVEGGVRVGGGADVGPGGVAECDKAVGGVGVALGDLPFAGAGVVLNQAGYVIVGVGEVEDALGRDDLAGAKGVAKD